MRLATAWPTRKTELRLVVHHLLELVLGKILERRAELHAGIVDENVDAADLGLDIVDGVADAVRTGDVEGDGPGPRAGIGEVGRSVAERFRCRAN